MCIFDIINKLENIKHNYLIYALEKYTNQITSDDIKKKEEERRKQEEIAKEEIKKSTEDVKKPTEDVKKPTEDVKTPVEDVKKPTEEVKKFENNIMDSLKWVFISIGIFIFIIIVASVIYWLMYSAGNNDDQNIITHDNNNDVKRYISPTNQYGYPKQNESIDNITAKEGKDGEGSIFSFITPFSKNEKSSESISKTKAPVEGNTYLETKGVLNPLPDSEHNLGKIMQSKSQSDMRDILEEKSNTRYLPESKSDIKDIPELKSYTNKIDEENNITPTEKKNETKLL